jgi:hypothetical protein
MKPRKGLHCPPHLSPDCRAGKHHACSDDAWCEALDRRADCECSCHDMVRHL